MKWFVYLFGMVVTLSGVLIYQKGVLLNTVRDLLGHSSVAMSLRYAHLAPDQRREAVAKLDEKPLFALTGESRSAPRPSTRRPAHSTINVTDDHSTRS
jgi:hypothetical protein